MAKKKNSKRNDARGYGQATPPPPPSLAAIAAEPQLSSQKQQQQQQQQQQQGTTASSQNQKELDGAQQQHHEHHQKEQPSIIIQSVASNNNMKMAIRKVPTKLVVPPSPITTTAPTMTIMTASLQDRLETLLQDLQQHHHHHQLTTSSLNKSTATSSDGLASDRFEKRLAGIYDYLIHYGFALQHIQKVVAALGHDITLTRALDWLCLHLDSIELPPLFTENQVRESLLQQQQSNISNSPEVWIAPTAPVSEMTDEKYMESTLDNQSPKQPTTRDNAEAKEGSAAAADDDDDDDDDDADKEDDDQGGDAIYQAANKERLLQMYQYEEEDHEDNEESVQQQQQLLLPEEERLAAAEKELDMARADVQDEAANYMRSKYEIKQLQKRVQQLQKHVSGLQRKASQARATAAAAAIIIAQNDENKEKNHHQQQQQQQQQEAEAIQQKDNIENDDDDDDGGNNNNINNNDDDSGGLFGMFNLDDTATADISNGDQEKSQSDTNQDSSSNNDTSNGNNINKEVFVPEDAIPKSWTGKTPKEVLEDWCRKQKLPRPIFTKLPQNGCLVRVKMLNNNNNNISSSSNDDIVEVQQQGPIHNFLDAQHYTSTKILYQINPNLPLYRLFPPAYRDLWKSWTLHVQTEKEQATMVEDQARRAILDQLLQLIPSTTAKSLSSSSSMATNTAKPKSSHINNGGDCDNNEDEDALDDYVTENWEDQGEKVVLSKNPKSNSNIKNKKTKLEEGFHHLKQTFRDRQTTSKYQTMYKQRCTLPIYAYRDEILDSVSKNPVTVLCAETGAGKTTQCPQFLLEHALQSGGGGGKDPADHDDSAANTCILVSQPRRIAATSVAERVAEEMCERSVGNLVGYQIRLEAKRTSQTRLLFCTTGVVLRRLIDDPYLSGVSHVVVDEVHERQWQIDVLMVSLRRLIDGPRPELKVLLMSATLDTSLFCTFFNGAPVLNVPGRTYPVSNYYLEDLMEATDFFIEDGSPFAIRKQKETTRMWVTQRGGEKRQETVMTEVEIDKVSDDYIGYSMSTRRSMDRVDETKINCDLIEDVLMKLIVDKVPSDVLVPPAGAQLQSGAVIIFLPGLGEIRTLSERLQSNRIFGDTKRFEVIPMHSALSASDQRKAFIVPRKVEWAIIVSTNIAETSVTIPDAVCVIDSGRVREVRHDKRTLTRKLVTDWCSRASTKQRGGRAGRVQSGICLKLFSSQTERSMNAATEPEIKRLPLEEVCLTILAGGFARNCVEFLGQTPQPPGDDAVRLALSVLAGIGAVAFGPDSTELLTPLGRHLSKLPVDCRLGKMLIFGVILQCIETIATIVAGLSASQSLFVTSLNDGQLAKAKKATFTYPNSDFLTLVNVYEAYIAADKIGKGRQFCRENYVSLSALREIKDGRKHYLELLRGIGFSIKLGPTACTSGGYRKDEGVIHAVICAGLYPNVARIDRTPSGDSVWHKKERLYIHSSSVNVKLPRSLQSPWLAFHEKFGTTSRVSMSTCCFVHPFALLLFGGALEVRHAERRVILDDWIELSLAAKTGVIFSELRQHIDAMLEAAVQSADSSFLDNQNVARIVQDIVGLLS